MTNPQPEARESGVVARSIDEFVNQLRRFTDRAQNLAGAAPARIVLPRLPSPPGAMSAAQLRAIAKAVRAQRQSLAAMREQLDAYDEQMAVFERILDPLLEWSTTWARLERAVSDLVPRNRSGEETGA
jgi:hypothetical protein